MMIAIQFVYVECRSTSTYTDFIQQLLVVDKLLYNIILNNRNFSISISHSCGSVNGIIICVENYSLHQSLRLKSGISRFGCCKIT